MSFGCLAGVLNCLVDGTGFDTRTRGLGGLISSTELRASSSTMATATPSRPGRNTRRISNHPITTEAGTGGLGTVPLSCFRTRTRLGTADGASLSFDSCVVRTVERGLRHSNTVNRWAVKCLGNV